MDLATRIRAQLNEGRTPDEVVAGLVASGMSEATAWRIVTKILSAPASPAEPASSKVDGTLIDDPHGRWSMVSGAFLFSLGCSLVWVTQLVGKPNPKARVTYLAILGGLAAIYKGLKRWEPAHSRFPTAMFLAALLAPAIGTYALYESRRPATVEEVLAAAQREEQREKAEQQRLAAEKAERDKREGQRIMADALRTNAQTADALQKMMDGNPALRCQGAAYFRTNRIVDESGELERLLETDPDNNVRRCAVDSLIATGRSAGALRIVEKLAPFEDRRTLVSYALPKMLQDPDPAVRARAAAVLDRIK